jgi:hypothetical protein
MYEGMSGPRHLDEHDRRYLVFRGGICISDPVGAGGMFTTRAIVSGTEDDEQ